MKVEGLTPILNVSDIAGTFGWFEKWGWKKLWDWGTPPRFGAVGSGKEICIFLCQGGQGGRGRGANTTTFQRNGDEQGDKGVWMSVWVDDVDEMHKRCVAAGLEVTLPPTDMSWNVREMHLRHPDGHIFRVSRTSKKNTVTVASYRDFELGIARDPGHKLHLLPAVPSDVHRILDVGCHAGHILEALQLPPDCEVFGCDINAEALELARRYVPYASFAQASAEKLPYQDSYFDFVFARSTAFMVDIPKALLELNRVLKRGGRLWLSLHRWSDLCVILSQSWTDRPVKTFMFGIYALMNGALFHCTGKLVHYPLNRSRIMSFQTESGMRRELERAGFGSIRFSGGQYLVVQSERT